MVNKINKYLLNNIHNKIYSNSYKKFIFLIIQIMYKKYKVLETMYKILIAQDKFNKQTKLLFNPDLWVFKKLEVYIRTNQ